MPDSEDQNDDAPAAYHKWYYNNLVWQSTTWLGVPILKSVSDMWNYQEILNLLRPSLVVEFGTGLGGSALFFATIMEKLRNDYRVFTVDIDRRQINERVLAHERIEVFTASSTDESVRRRISELRVEHPGPTFAILDSAHSEAHVFAELELLRTILVAGDYVVVEDTNLNGHPVLPDYGPGPYEAVQRFFSEYPGQFWQDRARETKFGFSFALRGFLVKLR